MMFVMNLIYQKNLLHNKSSFNNINNFYIIVFEKNL